MTTLQNTLKKNPHSTLVEFSKIRAKLILTEKVVEQIKFLCSKIPTVEWSGVLYHTSEGDIGNPKEFVCKAEHILLLDKGSSAYTEYDFSSPNFTEALMDNPQFMDWSMSHIHSHNSMAVFFSGTDNEELTDNAPNYNYYLSLIVNNKNEYCARIAFIGEIEGRTIKFKNKGGDQEEIKVPNQLCTFYHECDIVTESGSLIDAEFIKQYDKVIAADNKRLPVYHNQGSTTFYPNNHNRQSQLNFVGGDDDYKWDSEAAAFVRWILSPPTTGLKTKKPLYYCRFNTVQAALDSIDLKSLKAVDFLNEQVDSADKIYENFSTDVNYDAEGSLAELWMATCVFLEKSMFKNHPVAVKLFNIMDKWTWT